MQINPYTTGLNQNNALLMARLSKHVYTSISETDLEPDAEKILQDLKATDARYIAVSGYDKNSAQAMFVEHQDYLAMVFRGTDELKDWWDNLDVFVEQALFGEFHRGFWNSVEDLWHRLDNDLRAAREVKKRPLFIAGHSLGGAMATITAARLIHKDRPFTSVYTFGQPRAVSRDTARLFNSEARSKYHRFQNNEDIVTRVPARLMNYSHVGRCVYIDSERRLHADPGFWLKFLDTVEGSIESFIGDDKFGFVGDHNIDRYIEAIEDWDLQA